MRRFLLTLLVVIVFIPVSARTKEKGKFDLYQNGINKGYEKYKIQNKKGTTVISSEVRFKLPMVKAKRNYVDLYLYPILKLNQATSSFESYEFRLLYNDFTDKDITEAQDSATEIIDQDMRNYDLFHRSQQIQDDIMHNRIDLGVNSGKLTKRGNVLHFEETTRSHTRAKDEELPDNIFIADSYIFCPYFPLAKRAMAMNGVSEPISIVSPQALSLKEGRLEYMGTTKALVNHEMHVLKRYDVTIKNLVQSSFWMDKNGTVVQIVVPSLGLTAMRADYEIKDFAKEQPRIFRQSIDKNDSSAFEQKDVVIKSGGIDIAGTLTTPAGKGPFPAILMIQDLEPLDRNGNDPSNSYSLAGTWKQLSFYLASCGFATLRFDSPGVGASGGDKSQIDPESRIKDVKAMLDWLVNLPSTEDKKVVLMSQGLGGIIAAGAASDPSLKGIVAFSYPAKDLVRLWKEQISTIEDPEKRQKAYADIDQLQIAIKSGKGSTVEFKGRKLKLSGVRDLAELNPVKMANDIQVPCLFVYPTGDMVVMGYHKTLIEEHLHNGQKAIAIEGLSHQLTKALSAHKMGGIVDTKALSPIADWIRALYNPGKSN